MNIRIPGDFPPLPLYDALRRLRFSLTLRRKLKQVPGSLALNGTPAAWQDWVRPGDNLTVIWPEESALQPLDLPLCLRYEDEHLLVADKPAGMLVYPTDNPAEPTLANAVLFHLASRGQQRCFHPVHRLDRQTSGLIVIAKNPLIHHLLAAEGEKKLIREYLAVVSGVILPPAGTVDAPIARHPASIITRIVHPAGQTAITCYETLRQFAGYALVKLRLVTGRTHQIRVHMAHIGHPLLGDELYGGSREYIGRQALHAARLAFDHPLTGQPVTITSPLPNDIDALLEMCPNHEPL